MSSTKEHQKEIMDLLKEKGVKITPQRMAVIEYLRDNNIHPSADVIFEHLKQLYPSISFATIYNTIEMLESIHRVVKLKISDDNKTFYDYHTDLHHHFFCKKCAQIFDINVSCQYLATKEVDGHKISEIHGYFKGLCCECRSKIKEEVQ